MKALDIGNGLQTVSGEWRTFQQLNAWDFEQREVYRSPHEPGYVCWVILWKEPGGGVKLSFTEAVGDPALWPPAYNFNSRGVEYYLKTLVSEDGGRTWIDSGWREDLDPLWELNADHHIRHVLAMPDGALLRNYPHTLQGVTGTHRNYEYDESMAMRDFPFREGEQISFHPKLSSVWTSRNGGKTWDEIGLICMAPAFFASAFHRLGDGSIVAAGAVMDELRFRGLAVSESWDGGATWSVPSILAGDDDALAVWGLCEECDFVELPDGRLLLIQRTDGPGMNMLQAYLTRNDSGEWEMSDNTTHPLFLHSGYPFTYRAEDGAVFYYSHAGILYTCDGGGSWHWLTRDHSYYGQLVEVAPGRMLAVTQMNIGDGAYPCRHDASIVQSTFSFERTDALEQTDPRESGAVALLSAETATNFHVCAEVRADGESGLVFNAGPDSYGFAAVVIPCNEFRSPERSAGEPQDALLVVGRYENGAARVIRRVWAGRIAPGSWVEMQLDMSGALLKAAVKAPAQESPASYLVLRDDFGSRGRLGCFTNRSTGAFRNMRMGQGGIEIRSNWRSSSVETGGAIALDAGRHTEGETH